MPGTIRVRPAREGDDRCVAALGHGLSAESLRRRFLAGIARDVALDELERETNATGGDIALVAEDAAGAIVGEAYAAKLDPSSAEAAFVVADELQHQGVGTLLFGAVTRELARRGVRTMLIETLAQNREMVALVEASGLPHTARRTGGTVEFSVELRAAAAAPPPPASGG
jgi:acetyltransferase